MLGLFGVVGGVVQEWCCGWSSPQGGFGDCVRDQSRGFPQGLEGGRRWTMRDHEQKQRGAKRFSTGMAPAHGMGALNSSCPRHLVAIRLRTLWCVGALDLWCTGATRPALR